MIDSYIRIRINCRGMTHNLKYSMIVAKHQELEKVGSLKQSPQRENALLDNSVFLPPVFIVKAFLF